MEGGEGHEVNPSNGNTKQKQEDHMGTLYKRGAVWWIKYYQNGRRHARVVAQHEGVGQPSSC